MSDPTGIEDFDVALVPMQLDAFVLNPAVCGTGRDDDTSARICPITQPNYTFLRLDSFLLQSDVQNHVALHNTAPASINSRLTDLGGRPNPTPLRHRHGVYVYWTLPRFYRSGVSATESVPESRRKHERLRRGMDAVSTSAEESAPGGTPDFLQPPTRWIVVRQIELDSIQPPSAKNAFKDREYEAWVVESDHVWSLEDIPVQADLQTDVAPFVLGHAGTNVNINEQAEVFIGRKTPLKEWSEDLNPSVEPPDISLLRSGNQLFADFQMHNTNVFSILDNFEYGDKNNFSYLDYAKASYYVMGWHWKETVDPLWNSGANVTHGESLQSLFMTLQGTDEANPDPWMDLQSQLRILCHGSMYDVTWDHENKPKSVPADAFSDRLRDQSQAAIAVGTTPMGALLAYCHARADAGEDADDVAKLEEDILALESLLQARDDGVEGQREAKDSVYNWSYTRSPGGTKYFFAESDDTSTNQPTEPPPEVIQALNELNLTQALQDSCERAMVQYRWDMFSLWWKYAREDQGNDQNETFKADAARISTRIRGLQTRIGNLQTRVQLLLRNSALSTVESTSEPVFYEGNDPTVLIGGIPSGWALDYLDNLAIRAPYQIIVPDQDPPTGLQAMTLILSSKLPGILAEASRALLSEFHALRPSGNDAGTPAEGTFYPQFHDQLTTDGRWRDRWGDRQPWFPLYAEWEVEYTHIPFEYWKLDEHTARHSEDKLVRYGVTVPSSRDPPPPLWEALGQKDIRILSGRVLILPQPSFALGAKIKQLFQNTPPSILDKYLPKDQRENLLANIGKLSYLSSPLSGFASGLVTQAEGSHLKPENKVVGPEGEFSYVINAAAFNAAGLTEDNLKLINGESALTPYAALVNFTDSDNCPFKPVTHGQFRFRKFNVIDKFGQALMAIDQKPRRNGPPPVYPCISNFYAPQEITVDGEKYANTVIQDRSEQCEFLQLPPQINQPARINAKFVRRISDDPNPVFQGSAAWRPVTEWESPIWGWVITNYADYGIQLFLPDGTFYREVRVGGPLGTLVSPKWLPFAPDPDAQPTPDTRELDALISRLADPKYLLGFWGMITTAQQKLPPAPGAYAQFLNSIVGKPLALVNTGWSVELSGPPLEIQSTQAKVVKPERTLLKSSEPNDNTPHYELQLRLGNEEAGYDGLVGYFDTTNSTSDQLNYDKIKTFFLPDGRPTEPLIGLDTEEYPIFEPYWQPPYAESSTVDPFVYEDHRNSRMCVFGAILDPFTPVHAYSSFLPAAELLLPPWTWQKAMDTMTAFFHAGPLTMPVNDVPEYDEAERLTTKNARDMPKRSLLLPSLGGGDWSWFQPYAEGQSAEDEEGNSEAIYNAFGIEKKGDLIKPGFQDGPYTAIEGFLQLRNPVMAPANK
ncbi:hypothetical protein NW752_007604 [Fusarium irregulare]|uniref:Uncharacterized protein n=1 Tax=Fusarium irregulare TaxID=2494466 RepID=A0A9W8PHV3_9HYPO|nr:hypothetical protein NW766_010100 [Fusarium irregulare]KAJ4013307.1 hypothetical protein NW752_007604 [Fusarium irregulare]